MYQIVVVVVVVVVVLREFKRKCEPEKFNA